MQTDKHTIEISILCLQNMRSSSINWEDHQFRPYIDIAFTLGILIRLLLFFLPPIRSLQHFQNAF